ncbi:substrate-binding domain-containing protein [Mesorhizobium sp.]|uniref:substrate-binding domain-containing protein n=1 Tax=Mesorhizobium sp. TaxID=1871066 RepID=UPI0025D85E62|nr:substrate-binding domain-containing protein [Mesorhizobium sp.]
MASPENPFYVGLRSAVVQETDALSYLNIRSFILDFERTTPEGIIARLRGLEKEYDAVVATCYSTPSINAALRQISGKVPLIAFINDLPDSGRLAYFGPDHERSGRVAGELMGRFLGGEGGGVLLIQGFRSMLNQSMRERGFRAVMSERFPQCTVLASGESEDAPERPGQIVLEEFRRHPSMRGIYNMSSGSRSVAAARQRLGDSGSMVYITHELTASRRALLRAGLVDAVIDHNNNVAARSLLNFLAAHFGRMLPQAPEPFTPFQIYLRENC